MKALIFFVFGIFCFSSSLLAQLPIAFTGNTYEQPHKIVRIQQIGAPPSSGEGLIIGDFSPRFVADNASVRIQCRQKETLVLYLTGNEIATQQKVILRLPQSGTYEVSLPMYDIPFGNYTVLIKRKNTYWGSRAIRVRKG